MTALKLAVVVRHSKEIVYQGLALLLFLANNVLAHVKTLEWERDCSVLLLLHSLEPLEVDNKDSR